MSTVFQTHVTPGNLDEFLGSAGDNRKVFAWNCGFGDLLN
jgi:hypothetical protein